MNATPNAAAPTGYRTTQESSAVHGVDNILIRSLLDKQQFHDPYEEALQQGISSAAWPLFGLLWPSGLHLAERLAQRPVQAGERILEVGCFLCNTAMAAGGRCPCTTGLRRPSRQGHPRWFLMHAWASQRRCKGAST